jgi:altered-inheritance-of-mitochondria protein 13
VTSELERIRDQEAARLAQYTQQLTSSDSSDSSDSDSSDSSSPSMTQKLSSAFSSNSSTSNDKKKDSLSNQSVSKEVNDLRSKLERRKMIGGGPENKELDAAKQNLVHCLRLNDRRPLDCWEQVETFKAEVAKLEQSFVNRALQ